MASIRSERCNDIIQTRKQNILCRDVNPFQNAKVCLLRWFNCFKRKLPGHPTMDQLWPSFFFSIKARISTPWSMNIRTFFPRRRPILWPKGKNGSKKERFYETPIRNLLFQMTIILTIFHISTGGKFHMCLA